MASLEYVIKSFSNRVTVKIPDPTNQSKKVEEMITQLRIYTINRGQLHQFAREWEEKIRPLRESLGFQVTGAWLLEETNQFVWLLSYEGSENWETLDAAYYSSPARLAMDPNPARLIARAEEYFANRIL